MGQIRLYLTAPKADAEALFARLDAALEDDGLPLAILETSEDSGIFEVSVYVDADENDTVKARIRQAIDTSRDQLTIGEETLPDIDWVAKSLEGLKPVGAGRFIIHGAHDRAALPAGAIGIEIEAGQAFGTGHHGTTAGCLIMLERLINARRPSRSLDLGTGSGVLAIAIAKLTHTPVLATDIDPIATRVARANAELNGVAPVVHARTAPGLRHRVFADEGPFELIVANILARPLMAMAPQIAQLLAPRGRVILSGILAGQRWQVLAAFRAASLYHRRTIWRGDWVTIELGRT